jgi:hypothetical protein
VRVDLRWRGDALQRSTDAQARIRAPPGVDVEGIFGGLAEARPEQQGGAESPCTPFAALAMHLQCSMEEGGGVAVSISLLLVSSSFFVDVKNLKVNLPGWWTGAGPL